MRVFLYFFIGLLANTFFATQTLSQVQYAYRVSFTDKNATPYSLSRPTDYLSSRSIARRTIQSIIVDSTDLPVCARYVDSVLQITHGILHTRSRWQNNCIVLLNDSLSIPSIRSLSFVRSAQLIAAFSSPLHYFRSDTTIVAKKTSAAPRLRTTSGVAYYGDAYDQIALANGYALHDKGFRGAGKMIAVLDEGFYLVNTLPGFDSLRITGRIVDTYNINLDTDYVYAYSAHGTEVLSTMAGILNGQYVGTAPDATYALYITENSTSEQPFEMDNLLAGMERADSVGADIITISLGYNTMNIGAQNADLSLSDIDGKSTVAAKAANAASQKGILVVASAGNEGNTAWNKILTPGDADSALTCGSVDINKIHASTSGNGPNASGMLKPDVCMLGAPGIVFNNTGTTSAVGGTSIATPELAGLAACLWQTKPNATPYQLKKAIRESAHIAASPNNQLGYGVPNFATANVSFSACICLPDSIYIQPNPINEHFRVQFVGTTTNMIQWRIVDLLGKLILQGATNVNASTNYIDITMPTHIPSSIYVLQLISETQYRSFPLLKN
jgi:serine protease AprX